jgi:signal transduction histidine kinase
MTTETATPTAPRPPGPAAVRTRPPGRWEATGYAFLYLLLWAPVLAVFIVTVVGVPLVLVTAGVLLLIWSVPLLGALASVHRRCAENILGVDVPAGYVSTDGQGLLHRLQTWLRDPARWRDLLWALVSTAAGFPLSLLAVIPLAGFVWWLTFPLVFGVTPDGVFDTPLGFMTIDTLGEAFLAWIPAALMLVIWFVVTPWLVRAVAMMDAALLSRDRTALLERRVETLTQTRAESVDFSAAELRRIERDLHDGAQARLVALGMSLGMAHELMERDPDAARRLLAEARDTSTAALGDLRSVVRGIHPPVLADRGLAGAVQALALDMPIPVMVSVEMTGRPPAPVEAAVYFAIAECLANIGKHAGARRAWVTMRHDGHDLAVEVGDDGRGGARPNAGTGMLGVMRRLSAFDGTMSVSSPEGGPTLVVMEVPTAITG